ncbi:MAG: TonB-dependent receptor [Cyclobacteriaceae bacterium]|nr:TonB-dependent receptor [Cyclobacteriaceae bacterium]
MVKWVSTFLLAGCLLPVMAQVDSTVHLNEVHVFGMPVTKYSPGGKIKPVSTGQAGTLTDLVAQQAPIYFKIYGNGQLATVALRGTSATQTAVLWNGINVNSPTLGQTDFSLWPAFLLDEVALHYGASGALYGSDALGGSVLLSNKIAAYSQKPQLVVQQEAGSFGHWLSGVKATYGTQKVELRTKAYHRQLQNEFEFTSPKVGHKKKQQFAAVDSYGFDQQVFIKISDAGELAAHAQYLHNFREVQPTVTSNSPGDVLQDDNTRLALTYRHDFASASLFSTVGYIINDQHYNRTVRTQSKQLSTVVQYDYTLNRRSNMRAGGNWSRITATTDSYATLQADHRFDAYVSYRYRITNHWLTSLNGRQAVYQNKTAPFSPAWGNEFALIKNERLQLSLRTQAGRGYRVPTLNDRYWQPGGNPNLKPESGWQAEAGFDIKKKTNASILSFEATHHRLWITDWIIWLPTQASIWTPANLSRVYVSGIESEISYQLTTVKAKWQWGYTYAYTQSLNKKGLTAFDAATVNKQLPYVPLHALRAFARSEFKTWRFEITGDYTSKRFTALDNAAYQALAAYALVAAAVDKNWYAGKNKFTVRCQGNNLLNTYYETIESRAMPGRNFLITFTYKF